MEKNVSTGQSSECESWLGGDIVLETTITSESLGKKNSSQAGSLTVSSTLSPVTRPASTTRKTLRNQIEEENKAPFRRYCRYRTEEIKSE